MAGEGEGNPLRPEHFKRYDESPDPEFYAQPRLVTHIDDAAIAAAGAFYARVLPAGGKVLDLMTSWVSHLPDASRYAGVAGLGMNAEELAANPQLTASHTRARVRGMSLCRMVLDLAALCPVHRIVRPGGGPEASPRSGVSRAR